MVEPAKGPRAGSRVQIISTDPGLCSRLLAPALLGAAGPAGQSHIWVHIQAAPARTTGDPTPTLHWLQDGRWLTGLMVVSQGLEL